MALNPFYNILSFSLVIGGISSLIFWHYKYELDRKVAGWGALAWLGSYLAMSVSDFFFRFFIFIPNSILPVYLGISAGIFHVLVPFFVIWKKTQIFKGFNHKVSFGLGYAGIELIFVGIMNMLIFSLLVSSPDLVSEFPQEAIGIFSFDTSYYVLWSFVTFFQAISVAFLHVFTVLLVFAYTYTKKHEWIIFAILFEIFLNSSANYLVNYAEALYIICAGVIFGIIWKYKEKIDIKKPQPLEAEKKTKKK